MKFFSDDKIDSESGNKLPVLQTATALAVSFAICKTGQLLTQHFGIQGGLLPIITAIVIILAASFPSQFAYLAPSGEAMTLILMQVSFHNIPSQIKAMYVKFYLNVVRLHCVFFFF